jgi:hypothetical protein
MTRNSITKHAANLEKVLASLPPHYALNLTILYEEAHSRNWARAVVNRVEKVVGSRAVRCTWWSMADLYHPGVLAGAVSKAMRADLIVVAARQAGGVPLPFYIWVNSWLPLRFQRNGALVDLLGRPEARDRRTDRMQKYLRSVARRGRLDLLLEERNCAPAISLLPSSVMPSWVWN